jgi:hypothetical protein
MITSWLKAFFLAFTMIGASSSQSVPAVAKVVIN